MFSDYRLNSKYSIIFRFIFCWFYFCNSLCVTVANESFFAHQASVLRCHWNNTTPYEIPEGLIIGWGPANKSCSLEWVCLENLIFGGLTPTPDPQGLLHQMEVFAMRIGQGPANKSYSLGWVCLVKFNFLGAHSNQGPCRVHSIKWGY